IKAGHRVVFIAGNHDVDLWFGRVRERLRYDILSRGLTGDQVDQGLVFEPWFYLDKSAVYIEHGHRFDPYATFPDPLMPLDAERKRYLAPNFGHFSLRYFCNRVRSFPIHDMDQNPFGKVWAWMRKQTLRTLFTASLQFAFFLIRYFTATIKDRRLKIASADIFLKRRRARLKAYARHYNLPLRRILALDALKRSHVGATVGRLFQALHLDRILAGTIAGIVILMGLLLTEGWLLVCLIAACLLGTRMVIQRLDRSRPIVDVQSILGRVAAKISRVTGASVVVFGHTHQPTLRRVGRARWLNPGSWEHLPWCRGHSKTEPCNCSVRFGLIRAQSGQANVELRRWCAHSGQPDGQSTTHA
ncbi:MAG: hypothetical protein VX589_00665, partial [Myxococcota bacterium]|nr:hypothetical protein [Myxococcota bacterium]